MITSDDIPAPKPATEHVVVDAPLMQDKPRFSSFAGLQALMGLRR